MIPPCLHPCSLGVILMVWCFPEMRDLAEYREGTGSLLLDLTYGSWLDFDCLAGEYYNPKLPTK